MTRWEALVRFDTEIREAAETLLPYGAEWVDELGKAFFALKEDRNYLPNIVQQLIKDAEYQAAIEEQRLAVAWLATFTSTADGEATSKEAIGILMDASAKGFCLSKDNTGTILASRLGVTYSLRSSWDIVQRLGTVLSRTSMP